VVNGKVVGAFASAVVLHALWDTFNLLRGVTFVGFLGLELLSLLVAVVSLTQLIRRIKEASREPPSFRE
jgi:RsiW-degrading membrane proteinase PrsW (M82 family)